MENGIFPWQAQAWADLQQMLPRLPHAILIHGPRGTGKTVFAERFAQALLCERPAAGGHACNSCPSCTWFAQYGHPDYRRVRPEILDDEPGADGEEGEEAEAAPARKGARASRPPSKEIRIAQVRALAEFVNVSTHRQGRRVILLYPAGALNTESANSLLKMLEEPPPATVFVLVADSLDRLLPTVLSRCRKFALGPPTPAQALQWLQAAGVADAPALLAAQGGAPLAAQEMAGSELREPLDEFVGHLAQPGVDGAIKAAERLQKTPLPLLVASLQRWLYDLFSLKLSGRIRYYPRYEKQLMALAGRANLAALGQALKAANERRAVADHPLNGRLFIEDMLLEYATLFSGQRNSR